jgi:hypothetical protein
MSTFRDGANNAVISFISCAMTGAPGNCLSKLPILAQPGSPIAAAASTTLLVNQCWHFTKNKAKYLHPKT